MRKIKIYKGKQWQVDIIDTFTGDKITIDNYHFNKKPYKEYTGLQNIGGGTMKTAKDRLKESGEEYLYLQHAGDGYVVNSKGYMLQENNNHNEFSDSWKLLGVSTHHMQTRPTITFKEIWENPYLVRNAYIWDRDHGTVRLWSGKYAGRLPRVSIAYKARYADREVIS